MKVIPLVIAAIVIVLLAGASYAVLNRDDSGREEAAVTATPVAGETANQFLQEAPDSAPPATDDATSTDTADTTTADLTGEEGVTVSMTETGFAPSKFTVTAGTVVTFINDGQVPHWPASAVHPTHEVLPDFDAKRGLQTGESYSFAFTQAGSWNFHDHLFPQFTGTITVR